MSGGAAECVRDAARAAMDSITASQHHGNTASRHYRIIASRHRGITIIHAFCDEMAEKRRLASAAPLSRSESLCVAARTTSSVRCILAALLGMSER